MSWSCVPSLLPLPSIQSSSQLSNQVLNYDISRLTLEDTFPENRLVKCLLGLSSETHISSRSQEMPDIIQLIKIIVSLSSNHRELKQKGQLVR